MLDHITRHRQEVYLSVSRVRKFRRKEGFEYALAGDIVTEQRPALRAPVWHGDLLLFS